MTEAPITAGPISCPFCGGAPNEEPMDNDVGVFWIVCDNVSGGCGCEGPYRHSKTEAIAAWNRRASPAHEPASRVEPGTEAKASDQDAVASRVAELERTLAPFAKLGKLYLEADSIATQGDNRPVWGYNSVDLTFGDFRRAALIHGGTHDRDAEPVCSIAEMKTSAGMDYFVHIRVGDREITPHMFKERWKAEYEVAEWKWLLNGGEKPDLMAYGPPRRRPHDRD